MLAVIVILLFIFWFLGYLNLPFLVIPGIILFNINGRPISLWDLLIFALIVWAIGILPSPIREIGMVLLILWVLSVLGILAITGLSSLLIIAIIAGLIIFIFTGGL